MRKQERVKEEEGGFDAKILRQDTLFVVKVFSRDMMEKME